MARNGNSRKEMAGADIDLGYATIAVHGVFTKIKAETKVTSVRLKLCLTLMRKGRLWKQRSVSADRWTTEVSMTPDLGFVRLYYFKLGLASQVLWFWNSQISLLWFWNNFLAVLRLTISTTSWPNDIKLITVLSSISHKPTFLQTILSMKKIILFKIDVICAWI